MTRAKGIKHERDNERREGMTMMTKIPDGDDMACFGFDCFPH